LSWVRLADSLAMSAARLMSSEAAYKYSGKTRGPAKSARIALNGKEDLTAGVA